MSSRRALRGEELRTAEQDVELICGATTFHLRTLRAEDFPSGSMGPKVDAACRFVESTGKPAMIGRLEDAAALVAGKAGTVVVAADAEDRSAP